jgi:acyl carrier protein
MGLDRQALLAYLSDHLRLDTSKVEDDSPLFSSSLLDSFHMVDLIVFMETQGGFKMKARDVSLDNLDTIASILAYTSTRAQT